MRNSILLFLFSLLIVQITKSEEPRLILVEQITTSSDNSPELYPIAQQFNNIVNSHSDVLPFTIHTNFNPNLFYEQRKDLSQRILIYKEQNEQYPIPSFYVNGKEVNGINNLNSAIINEQNKQSIIDLNVKKVNTSGEFLFVDVKLEADTTFGTQDLLFCAVIEKHINAPGVGNSNESDFYYVTRQIELQPTIGESILLNDENFMGKRFSFRKETFWNLDEIYAIAWVQNRETKEVLQVEKEKVYNDKPNILVNKDTIVFNDDNKNGPLFLEIYNSSMQNLTLNDITLASNDNFELQFNSESMMILPGMTKSISVLLKNKSVGEYNTTLTIESDSDVNSELTVPITAKIESSVSPVIVADVETIDFGDVSKQKTEIVTLTNDGTGDLVIDDISFDSNDGNEFSILNNFIPDIKPGESFFLQVNFKPTEERAYFSTMNIKSNASNEPTFKITVKGTGADMVPFASILVNTDSLDFGTTDFTTPSVKSVVITNTGNQPLEVKNSGIEGDIGQAFEFVGEKDITVEAESSDSLTIEFLPTENEEYSANLVIRSNDTDPAKRRITIPLVGKGDGVSNVKQFSSNFNITYFNKVLNIENKGKSIRNMSVVINDIVGAVVLEKDIPVTNSNVSIKTDKLNSNQVYLFRIYSSGKLLGSGKFINN